MDLNQLFALRKIRKSHLDKQEEELQNALQLRDVAISRFEQATKDQEEFAEKLPIKINQFYQELMGKLVQKDDIDDVKFRADDLYAQLERLKAITAERKKSAENAVAFVEICLKNRHDAVIKLEAFDEIIKERKLEITQGEQMAETNLIDEFSESAFIRNKIKIN